MPEKRNMINDILNGQYEKPQVSIKGWVYHITNENGNISWIIRDRTGFIQVILDKEQLSEKYTQVFNIRRESAVRINGTVLQDNPPKIKANYLDVLSLSQDYPPLEEISKSEYRYLQLREPKKRATTIIMDTAANVIRAYLKDKGFTELFPPTITRMAAEDASTLFDLMYFEEPAHLIQTTQLYLEANLPVFENVFSLIPTYRKEKEKSSKHLSEFYTVEVQQAFATSDDMMELLEDLFVTTVKTITEVNPEELKTLGRDPSKFELNTPFRRFTYDESIEILNKASRIEKGEEVKVDWKKGFSSYQKSILSESGVQPFSITDFPVTARTIFMKPDSQKSDIAKSFDLIAPISEEVASGGEIITDHDLLLERIKHKELPIARYKWYLDLMKHGVVEHAGFGAGLERLLMYPTGLTSIRDVSLFPRFYGESPEP